MTSQVYSWPAGRIAALTLALIAPPFATVADSDPVAPPPPAVLGVDFIAGAYLEGLDAVAVTGHYGLVGTLREKGNGLVLRTLDSAPDEDFTALARLSDTEALIGSSTGRIYHFDGAELTELQALSEYDEPVLDIATSPTVSFAVGARGLIARSTDGRTWENLEIRNVDQPEIVWPSTEPADWYFGVANVDLDTVEFTAFVDGEPAIADQHYSIYSDEGFLQITQALDPEPAPRITFKFQPGPPFRVGDVSWNAVLLEGDTVTIAGEFGMILQSSDGGDTWIRRDTEIHPREPEPAYWLAGMQKGQTMWLTGAAGVAQLSRDGGVTWEPQPRPGREGIFGIGITASELPIIAGAVGLIGTFDGNDWSLADRTQLKLLSWLKTPIRMKDDSTLVLGGRATAIRFKAGKWTRVPVSAE